jgi:VWFA-related protein
MRKLTLLLILATITTLPAIAARRVTVEQLEQALATAHGRPDAEVALQLSDLELTERLSAGRFAKLRAEMPGEASEHGLTALADLSEFLNPPATEIPATPTPTLAAQRQMMALVVTYVTQTTHQLPNFFATRKTNRFEDLQHLTDKPVPLYFVAKSSKTVFYRDGKELVTTAEGKVKAERSDTQGLVSWGEFGPILGTVLLDAARSKLAWSHWEQGAGGPEAVFGYAVTGEKSHYSVHFCCVMGASGASDPFNKLAVYHGEIAVDPATGAILRLTLEADFDTDSPVTKAAIMVEYGDQEIGGKSFTCPVRSVAISVVQPTYSTYDSSGMRSIFSPQPHKTYLNDVAFGQYHRLGSEARILTDASDEPPANPPASVPEAVASPNSQPAPAGLPASTETAPAPTSAPVAAAAPAQPPATEPETSVEAANGIPNAPVNAPAPAGGAIVLKMTSRLVDVGVVVVDKKGHPVGDLKPEDFELLDNGRKQEIKFFSEIVGTAAGEGAAATGNPSGATGELDRTFSNRPDDTSGTGTGTVKPAAATEGDSTILLLDESHISWDDLSNARREMLKFLNALAPGERVGLYTLTGLGFRVLTEATSDHAALIARLNKWMPDAQSVSQAQEEETRNRQHFDTVRNLSDLGSVNGNETAVPDGATPVDPKLLALGDNPGRASLIILSTVARHLAALPGHKSLVWVSSDNVFVNWNDLTVSSNKVTDGVDLFALHAQEAMNDAHVAVYPFDVS